MYNSDILQAAEAIGSAQALLIGAGAGMGVDSGLPDFRGPEGFWKAYPPFRGKSFAQLSTPHWFDTDPQLAWGFFGHRYQLYSQATPHAGYQILRCWAERTPGGAFIFTTNVDGHFLRAGFSADQVLEFHGSIHHLQCSANCTGDIWPAGELQFDIDPDTIRCRSAWPLCPHCAAVARPNILMFGDYGWNDARAETQLRCYTRWLAAQADQQIVAVELGAGLAIPTVRLECEQQAAMVIRINPRDAQSPPGGISISLGALSALEQLDTILRGGEGGVL